VLILLWAGRTIVADSVIAALPAVEGDQAPEWYVRGGWWSDGEFKTRLGPITHRMNAKLADYCGELQAVFEAHIAENTDSSVADAVRSDTLVACRTSAWRDLALDASQWAYSWLRDGSGFIAAVVVASFVSRGPGWLEATLALAIMIGLLAPIDHDDILVGALAVALLVLAALLVRPIPELTVWETLSAAFLAAGATVAVIQIAHRVISRFSRPSSSVVVLGATAAASLAIWQYVETDPWPTWLRLGFGAFLVAGLGASVGLAFLQFGYNAFEKLHEARKLRTMPEAEFVQSTLWVIGGMERPAPETAMTNGYQYRSDVVYFGTDWVRRDIVAAVEYLAIVLERGVATAMAREDPASAELVASELAKGAEALRTRKRALLLGRPNAKAELLQTVSACVAAAAARDWQALPKATPGETTKQRRSVRTLRLVGRGTTLALPIGLAVVAWKIDQPDLIPFAALWGAVALAELFTPGAGAEIAKSASDADKVATLGRLRSTT
jgi:hypothetical protein